MQRALKKETYMHLKKKENGFSDLYFIFVFWLLAICVMYLYYSVFCLQFNLSHLSLILNDSKT